MGGKQFVNYCQFRSGFAVKSVHATEWKRQEREGGGCNACYGRLPVLAAKCAVKQVAVDRSCQTKAAGHA